MGSAESELENLLIRRTCSAASKGLYGRLQACPTLEVQLRWRGLHPFSMFLDERFDLCQNARMLRGDVVVLAGIDFEIEEERQVVLVGLGLAVAGLGEEV